MAFDLSAIRTAIAGSVVGFCGTLTRIYGVGWGSAKILGSVFAGSREILVNCFSANGVSSILGSALETVANAKSISCTIHVSNNNAGS